MADKTDLYLKKGPKGLIRWSHLIVDEIFKSKPRTGRNTYIDQTDSGVAISSDASGENQPGSFPFQIIDDTGSGPGASPMIKINPYSYIIQDISLQDTPLAISNLSSDFSPSADSLIWVDLPVNPDLTFGTPIIGIGNTGSYPAWPSIVKIESGLQTHATALIGYAIPTTDKRIATVAYTGFQFLQVLQQNLIIKNASIGGNGVIILEPTGWGPYIPSVP